MYAKNPYEGNEDEWLEKCSMAQSGEAEAKQCREFKTYYNNQTSDLKQQVADLKSVRDGLNEDLSNIHEKIKELDTQITAINEQIAGVQSRMNEIQHNIDHLHIQMEEKKKIIRHLDKQVKQRMRHEQPTIGTNRYIDIIMGAHDFMDMIALINGLNLVTQNDQDQIESAKKAREELKLQQEEQKRLQDNLVAQKQESEDLKSVLTTGKEEQEKLYESYYKKQQDIMSQMEHAQADISGMQGAIAQINTNVRDDIFVQPDLDDSQAEEMPSPGNDGWIKPIFYAWYSGTWSYDGGGLYPHLGIDYSGLIGAPIVAPARSIVLYANDPYPSNQVDSILGWPYGGGNTMHLLTQVNGFTYGISFFHLSKGLLVSAGDLVEQGQTVAYSGSSGNVTRPHLHVEVINLGSMSIT